MRIKRYSAEGEDFDSKEFFSLMSRMKTIADFLKIGGVIRMPDLILRFETLEADLKEAARVLGLSPPQRLPHLNTSADRSGARQGLKSDARIIEAVHRHFAEDYRLFEFATA